MVKSLNLLEKGGAGIIRVLPTDASVRQSLLTYGLYEGKTVRLLQAFPSQNLCLIACNGRKIAMRNQDISEIQVEVV